MSIIKRAERAVEDTQTVVTAAVAISVVALVIAVVALAVAARK